MRFSSSAKRLVVALAIFVTPFASIEACGGSSDDTVADIDSAADDAASADESILADDANDTGISDGSRDGANFDASTSDAAKIQNRCGGYTALDFEGHLVTPGDSCGTCNDGTIACIGSNTVACAGGSNPPCPTPHVDAGPNACGGYGSLTFMSVDASLGDPCGECGEILCASSTSLVCVGVNGYCATDAGLASTCTISDTAYTTPVAAPTLPTETRPTTTTVASIGLESNALAYNPYDGLLYAAVSNSVPSQGNSIAVIDPTSATVVASIYVGLQPNKIALSDDGQVLWVYLGGSAQIRRVDLKTRTAGLTVNFPPTTTIYDLQVLPGSHDSVVVLGYEYSSSYGAYSLVVYDNGTPRPYGVQTYSTQLLTTSSASLIFASYIYSILPVCADVNGAFAQTPLSTDTSYYNTTDAFSTGTIYTADAHAYDAKSDTLLATFNLTSGANTNGLVTTDAKDVYYLTAVYHTNDGYWIQATGFDRTSYASTTSDLLLIDGNLGGSFVRWGRYGFAFLSNGNIEIARSTIIPDSP